MYDNYQLQRKRFGLDPNISQRLDPDQELESMIVFKQEESELTDLPWYILNPKKAVYHMIYLEIQLMTWLSVVITPLSIVFDMMGE